MKDFIDSTPDVRGTPINRANLMAAQGFVTSDIKYDGENRIIQKFPNGERLVTTRYADGTFSQVFVGSKTITKNIAFNNDGTITEVIV